MIDPIVEVDRLKHNLRMAGLPTSDIDEIGDLASQNIDDAIFDLTQDYLNQARDIVYSLGGEQLADELMYVKRGAQFLITTESGMTDFSTQPFHMLPHLLKNAKISKTGKLYKIIPIRSKSKQSGPSNIFDVYRDRNANVRQAQQERQQKWDDVRAAESIDRRSLHFSGLAQAKRYLAKRQTSNKEDNSVNSGGAVEFRTATSDQDPNKDWVIPGKDMDITNILNDINSEMEDNIDKTITEIIDTYRGLI